MYSSGVICTCWLCLLLKYSLQLSGIKTDCYMVACADCCLSIHPISWSNVSELLAELVHSSRDLIIIV